MLAYHIDTFYDNTVLVCDDSEDLACLALVISGIYIHGVAFLDVKLFHNSLDIKGPPVPVKRSSYNSHAALWQLGRRYVYP